MTIDCKLSEGISLMYQHQEEGFNILYRHTFQYVYNYAMYLMKNEQDAQDIVQETFLIAYQNITALSNVNYIYSWLKGIVYRQSMRFLRKKHEIPVNENTEKWLYNISSNDIYTLPEKITDIRETSKDIFDMIHLLPESQQTAVIAFYYHNIKIVDIANNCHCSPNTIKSRLYYAKRFLYKECTCNHSKYCFSYAF